MHVKVKKVKKKKIKKTTLPASAVNKGADSGVHCESRDAEVDVQVKRYDQQCIRSDHVLYKGNQIWF